MVSKNKKEIVISICTGTGGVAAGGYKVIDAFNAAFKETDLSAEFTPRTHKVGCRGFCAKDVLVDVSVNGQTYQFVTPEKVEKIVEDHLVGGKPVKKWLVAHARPGDFVLIQGDFGACFLMAVFSMDNGLVPLYSTTRRHAAEELQTDGRVKLIHHFRHERFRRYGV